MIPTIPEEFMDLVTRPVVVTLVTVMPDGQPQATPVWFSYDGTYILVNTARGRQKDRNMKNRAKVTVLAVDPENPYRYIEIRGEVAGEDEENGVAHINELSHKYTGNPDYYSSRPERRYEETRVIYKIAPTKILGH
jgi:PPOX class probable F420-dependent enzyme